MTMGAMDGRVLITTPNSLPTFDCCLTNYQVLNQHNNQLGGGACFHPAVFATLPVMPNANESVINFMRGRT